LTIPHDTVLWRGREAKFLGLPPVAETRHVTDKLVGSEVRFDGYISTTHKVINPDFGPILYEIHVPKGTSGGYIASLSNAGFEEETLLGRGLIGRVASVERGSFVGGYFKLKSGIDVRAW